jgi:Type ISP C-terminal specificity domain/N-6 DNA Methylase
MLTSQQYITNLDRLFATGNSSEHSYRGDLQQLLSGLLDDVLVTNEPKRIACGAPDYILTRKDVPIGYIEAKDIGTELGHTKHKEQFDRYKAALANLIITDYVQFHFFKNGELLDSVTIAEIAQGRVVSCPDNFAKFEALIVNFSLTVTPSIQSPVMLAKMMAAKAKLMAQVIQLALTEDDQSGGFFDEKRTDLQEQVSAFKEILIHDIDNASFADIYAQTIAYGLFAARYQDSSTETFSRQMAAILIPQSNPFLRKLFQYIAGYDLDHRLVWVVDELVQIFLASDVAGIMGGFGARTQQLDPIVHFYETFLAEYDPKLRKARGVWYTPQPVVDFIVRAVDDVLKMHFDLSQGLGDTSKTTIQLNVAGAGKNGQTVKKAVQVHKVQILDPATGTGTFLAQTVRHIYDQQFAAMPGSWSAYVDNELIPRLNGFELLMTSYAMAHLKLDMLLTQTGYKAASAAKRLQIYLTNSLEEHHRDTGSLFASWLSAEANEANRIKRDAPVMVVMGNPPYAVSSSNKGDWIQSLLLDYKKNLNERNIQPLSDDYIKFIRFGQHFVDKNGEGVLAYISNNSFIDGLIHRQMRHSLLTSFDDIYILDLHGNAKKKETAPDGSKDENVFDIMQGVSINIFIKTGKKKKGSLAKVFYQSLYGKRETKYQALLDSTLKNTAWQKLSPKAPDYFFTVKDFSNAKTYDSFIFLNDLFPISTSGVKTHDDENLVAFSEFEKHNQSYSFRPFDKRFICYDLHKVGRHRFQVMQHMLHENWGLLLPRQAITDQYGIFITKSLCDINYTGQAGQYGAGLLFPLYIYPDASAEIGTTARLPNLDGRIVNAISEAIDLPFVLEKARGKNSFSPIDLLDYIYAVLHSRDYRETYKAFLKIDFPRVPYPTDAPQFWRLVALGSKLRQWHLLELSDIKKAGVIYPEHGSHIVDKPRFEVDGTKRGGKVFINETQYFTGVPELAWNFYIGGYQPAQKWLKDRKGKALSPQEVGHYIQLIQALVETDKLMVQIDQSLSISV